MAGFKRLKASTLAKPPHVFADPYRIVLIEYIFDCLREYLVCEEVIPYDAPSFICCRSSHYVIPMHVFEETMRLNNVELDETFVPDEEYTEWR